MKFLLRFLIFCLRPFSKFFPDFIGGRIHRSRVRVPLNPPPGLVVKLAQSKEEWQQAFSLIHDFKVAAGYQLELSRDNLDASLYHALPTTYTVIVKEENIVVGTATIIADGPFGLPMDRLFDLSPIKAYGARICEISNLSLAKKTIVHKEILKAYLLRYVYRFCVSFIGTDSLVAAVPRRQFEEYRTILMFEKLYAQDTEAHPCKFGKPVICGLLDLRRAHTGFVEAYAHAPASKNLFAFFMSQRKKPNIFPSQKEFMRFRPQMTKELFRHFFVETFGLIESLPDDQLTSLASLFDQEAYADVFPAAWVERNIGRLLREPRYDTSIEGILIISGGPAPIPIRVKNVSSHGFCAHLKHRIRFGTPLRAYISLPGGRLGVLHGWPVWTDLKGRHGFRVDKANKAWVALVAMCREKSTEIQKV